MSYHDLDDAARNMIRRARLVSLGDGSGDHLTGTFAGLKGQQPEDVVLAHNFGFASAPMAGSSALLLRLGGGDSFHAIGFDDPRHRPKGLKPGEVVLYDASEQAISLVQKNIRVVTAQSVDVTAANFTWNGKKVKTE